MLGCASSKKHTVPVLSNCSGNLAQCTQHPPYCTPPCLGVILAYSNSLAGKLADITATKGLGNIGCFMGGGVATLLSMLALVLFAQFGDLGREDLVKQKNK